MICYRDTTFCASEVTEHTCGREFTEQDAIDAEKWWGGGKNSSIRRYDNR